MRKIAVSLLMLYVVSLIAPWRWVPLRADAPPPSAPVDTLCETVAPDAQSGSCCTETAAVEPAPNSNSATQACRCQGSCGGTCDCCAPLAKGLDEIDGLGRKLLHIVAAGCACGPDEQPSPSLRPHLSMSAAQLLWRPHEALQNTRIHTRVQQWTPPPPEHVPKV